MAKPEINGFNELAELLIQKYERYLPTAFDESLSILEKVNKIIQYLNQTGKLVNEVVRQWNEVMEWVMNDGIKEEIVNRLDEMTADGTLESIINEAIFGDLNNKINAVTTRVTTAENDIDDIRTDIGDLTTWRKHYQVISNAGTPDQVTERLQSALDNTDGYEWIVLQGDYQVNKNLVGVHANILSRNARLIFSNAGEGLTFRGVKKPVTPVAQAGYTQGREYLLLQDTTGISSGDMIHFVNTGETYIPHRSYYYKGTTTIVSQVESDRVYLSSVLPYDMAGVNKIEIYQPAKVNIQGKLRIQNSAPLPNGTNGLMLNFCAFSNIDGVMVDNYDSCISITRSCFMTLRNSRTLRAYYTGTGQSYGIIIASSNHVLIENCTTQSGRHGLATGGWEPCDNITLRNSSIMHEPQSSSRSLDAHYNMINFIIENVITDSFQIAGHVIAKNLTCHHREEPTSMIAQYDEYHKCSYSFDGLTMLNGGRIDLGAYAQSGGSITNVNKCGPISVRNAKGDLPCYLKLDSRGFGGSGATSVRSVEIVGTWNMGFVVGDNIDSFKLENMVMESDNTFFVQTQSDTVLKHGTVSNCKIPARYLALSLRNCRKITFISCIDISVATSAQRFSIAGPYTRVVFINTSFNNLAEGMDLSVEAYTMIDSSFAIYGTPEGIKKEL